MRSTAKRRHMDELSGVIVEAYYEDGDTAGISILCDNGEEIFLELTPQTRVLEGFLDAEVTVYGTSQVDEEDEEVFVVKDFQLLSEH